MSWIVFLSNYTITLKSVLVPPRIFSDDIIFYFFPAQYNTVSLATCGYWTLKNVASVTDQLNF